AAPAELHREIRSVLALLGDGHSFLLPPDEATRNATSGSGRMEVGRDGIDVGYIRLDGFNGRDRSQIDRFAATLSQQIHARAIEGVRGWLVDLRRNGGGNMWPMLAGLVSIIGTDHLGDFVDRQGRRVPWDLAESVAVPLPKIDPLEAPAAVLIGPTTA